MSNLSKRNQKGGKKVSHKKRSRRSVRGGGSPSPSRTGFTRNNRIVHGLLLLTKEAPSDEDLASAKNILNGVSLNDIFTNLTDLHTGTHEITGEEAKNVWKNIGRLRNPM